MIPWFARWWPLPATGILVTAGFMDAGLIGVRDLWWLVLLYAGFAGVGWLADQP